MTGSIPYGTTGDSAFVLARNSEFVAALAADNGRDISYVGTVTCFALELTTVCQRSGKERSKHGTRTSEEIETEGRDDLPPGDENHEPEPDDPVELGERFECALSRGRAG